MAMMVYKLNKKRRISIFSEELKFFFLKRLIELGGIGLFFAGLAGVASLLSYHPDDTSFNTISSAPVHNNIMGVLGSHGADILLQSLGYVAFLGPLLLLSWGTHIALMRHIDHIKWRIAAVPISFFFLCIMAGARGGTLGFLAIYKLQELHSFSWLTIILQGIFGVVGTGLYIWALDIPKTVWVVMGQWVGKALVHLFSRVRHLIVKDPFTHVADVQAQTLFEETEEEDVSIDTHIKPMPAINMRTQEAPPVGRQTMPHSNPGYKSPSLDLLQDDAGLKAPPTQKHTLQEQADKLLKVLTDFGIQGEIANVYPGPVVTLYEFRPAPGMKSARIISLSDDIARSMSAVSTRISNIPGYNALGIEMPNATRQTVYMRSVLANEAYERGAAKLPLILGKNISGDPVVADLGKMPHLLVAGTTGSGKSVAINAMILSLLYKLSPEECKFIMIDPKMLELSVYDGIPHLLSPVVTDPHKAVMALKWAVREMETRYQAMSKLGVRNIEGYNQRIARAIEKGEVLTRRLQTGFDPETGKPIFEEQSIELKTLPFIVVIVDEMADLMLVAGKDIESAVQRLAQMARAAGIHLIMATQRPSVDVITGTIKANFPTRISFQVTSKIDSRTILGEQGAEQLLGQGDMLYMAPGGRIARVHGPFVRDQEVESIVQFLKDQGEPEYETAVTEEGAEEFSIYGDSASGDSLYDQALSIVLQERKASTSFIQRQLQIGYNRAARIVEKMEQEGIVSKPNHVGKREILLQG